MWGEVVRVATPSATATRDIHMKSGASFPGCGSFHQAGGWGFKKEPGLPGEG